MTRTLLAFLVVGFSLMVGQPILAHHSESAEFDASKPVKVTGTISKVEWQNPHVWFYVDVKDESEEAVEWASFLVSDDLAAKFAEILKYIPSNPAKVDTIQGTTDQYKWIVKDVGGFSKGINVLDVLLENSVSEAYLNDGVEILNGTMTPEEAMADIRDVALEAKKKLGK